MSNKLSQEKGKNSSGFKKGFKSAFFYLCLMIVFFVAGFGFRYFQGRSASSDKIDDIGEIKNSNKFIFPLHDKKVPLENRMLIVTDKYKKGDLTSKVSSQTIKAYENYYKEIKNSEERFYKALKKYQNRPIAKRFMKDFNSNPYLVAMFSGEKKDKPNTWDNIKALKALTDIFSKYGKDPKFNALVKEISNDPEIKAVKNNISSAVMPILSSEETYNNTLNDNTSNADEAAETTEIKEAAEATEIIEAAETAASDKTAQTKKVTERYNKTENISEPDETFENTEINKSTEPAESAEINETIEPNETSNPSKIKEISEIPEGEEK